jgi:hypothetical protein
MYGCEGLRRFVWNLLFVSAIGINPSTAENKVCKPEKLSCPSGQYVEKRTWLSQYPELEDQGIDVVFFCKRYADKDVMTEIKDTIVFGYSKECDRIFTGNFSTHPVNLTFFWKNGQRRREVAFDKDGSKQSERFFSEEGDEIRVSGFSQPQPAAGSRRIPLKVFHLGYDVYFDRHHEELVGVCPDYPNSDFDLEIIESAFRKKHLSLAYRDISKRSVVFVSVPQYNSARTQAVFYYFSIFLRQCDSDNRCSADISAELKTAPVSGDVLQFGNATNASDGLTAELVDIAKRAIVRPTILCYYINKFTGRRY